MDETLFFAFLSCIFMVFSWNVLNNDILGYLFALLAGCFIIINFRNISLGGGI